MREPILITGAARSRTSLTAGIISICGAFGGDVTGPTPYNKKGQFENTHIRQHIVKPYLARMGVDKLGQRPLPKLNDLNMEPGLKDKIERTMRGEGYQHGPWYYKGAKVCLMWPVWDAEFPDARWIVVRRKAEDIAASCVRTPFMKAYGNEVGWLGWVAEHEERFDEMKTNCANVIEIDTDEIVAGDFSMIKQFVDDVDGLTWDQTKVAEFVTPSLTNRRAS